MNEYSKRETDLSGIEQTSGYQWRWWGEVGWGQGHSKGTDYCD